MDVENLAEATIKERITTAICDVIHCGVIHAQPILMADRHKCTIAAQAADAVLDILTKSPNPTPNHQKVLNLVARYYTVTTQEMLSNTRVRNIVHARHVAMYLCRHILGMSLLEIGHAFNRDHTTVMHALSKLDSGPSSDVRDLMQEAALLS